MVKSVQLKPNQYDIHPEKKKLFLNLFFFVKEKKITTIVCLHCANVFHNLIFLSRDPDTICLLSDEKATDKTSFSCETN